EELQRLAVGADHVVLHAGRDAYHSALLDLLRLAIEHRPPFAVDDIDQLIHLVDLGADLLARLQAHDDKLHVLAREQHLPEVGVVLRVGLQLADIGIAHLAALGRAGRISSSSPNHTSQATGAIDAAITT